MGSSDPNPYEANHVDDAGDRRPSVKRRWPAIASLLACSYYVVSALSLPFAGRFWVGELPVLAVPQLPKSFLKSAFQHLLLGMVEALGLSRGSRSPDYLATHDLALGLMLALPAVALAVALLLPKRVPNRGWWIAAVLLGAAIDAAVTFWFDHSFSLKLFNASYF